MLIEPAQQAVLASFKHQGFPRNMGVSIVALDVGRCVLDPFADAASQQHGFFHGGAIDALADTAGGYTAMTMVDGGRGVLTLEYKVNFLRTANGTLLVAESAVLRAGRSVIVTHTDVYALKDGQRTLCAAMKQSIIPAPTAPAAEWP